MLTIPGHLPKKMKGFKISRHHTYGDRMNLKKIIREWFKNESNEILAERSSKLAEMRFFRNIKVLDLFKGVLRKIIYASQKKLVSRDEFPRRR